MTLFLATSCAPPTLSTCHASSLRRTRICAQIPARDRVIDFGKHEGRMLGTLPSKYLTWVSKNLRARDFEEWAKLADEVLEDPFYKDRLEWESAERVLSGVGLKNAGPGDRSAESPVSELLEISERFGWDNEDKDAWSKVDFGLLGTSKGGRIPRKTVSPGREIGGVAGEGGEMGSQGKGWGARREGKSRSFGGLSAGPSRVTVEDFQPGGVFESKKVGLLSRGHRVTVGEEEEVEGEVAEVKREERRERQRIRREQQMRVLRREVGIKGNSNSGHGYGRKEQSGGRSGFSNPFPGREALLDKINKQS